jgi:hypothetical protein
MNSFGCCLEQGQGVDQDIDLAVSYYRKAASQFHPDGMYNFARCLEYGKGIDQDVFRAVKYYRLSAELNNAAAQNSFGIHLERGIGVHKNEFLAAQYYDRSAQQGHPDRANNFGFCLEHGHGVKQNIELAAQFYKFASDCGHSEAKQNYKRCLRLLGQWEVPDRSWEIVSHPPSVDHLFNIFHNFRQNPDRLDDDQRRLLNSFERLRSPTAILVISNSSEVKWILDKLGQGDSSIVKLSLDSKSVLGALKTSLNANCNELIEREAAILKRLKHPLVVELHKDISRRSNRNSTIVTKFALNGSLANHLPPTECGLIGATRITKIVVGIALAMKFVHSRYFIHRDLKPENILLDLNWNVRISDFGQSIDLRIPDIDSSADPHRHRDSSLPSIDSRYLAPECYDHHPHSQMSDVFSFGLILYELLSGKRAFPTELTDLEIMFKVAVKNQLPDIPKFVLPSARKLITDCWAIDPGDRPSFDDIVDRLKEMKFKVMPNVNSSKLWVFVKRIEEWEALNAGGL